MDMAAMFLEEQLARIRAGRANVAILDGVRVNSYGSMVPLNQVASVSVPDARTIAIKPWDRKAIRDIEKGIMDSDVGITPENNGEVVRLNLPQPTEERRRELVKQCKKEFGHPPVNVFQLGCVVSANTGPDALAITFLGKDRGPRS